MTQQMLPRGELLVLRTLSDKRVLLLLSGGLDSACCLSFLKSNGFVVDCVFVDYGQPAAAAEGKSAADIAKHYGCDLSLIKIANDRTISGGEIVGRNAALVFAALLSSQTPPPSICIGIHSGTPYFDCTEAFRSDLDQMVAESSNGLTRVLAPFVSWSKSDLISFAIDNNVPIDLTYSCEAANEPCGQCLSCKDRKLIACS